MELDSHAYTIVCGSKCIAMHFMGKECDIVPYTDAYNTINAVPIVQAATAYDNTETGETTILILNKPILMGETIDNTLDNTNQLSAYSITVKDNPFLVDPIFIATEGHNFMLLLSYKGTILVATTRNPTDKELQACPHVPVHWCMSGIYIIFASPRDRLQWKRRDLITLA